MALPTLRKAKRPDRGALRVLPRAPGRDRRAASPGARGKRGLPPPSADARPNETLATDTLNCVVAACSLLALWWGPGLYLLVLLAPALLHLAIIPRQRESLLALWGHLGELPAALGLTLLLLASSAVTFVVVCYPAESVASEVERQNAMNMNPPPWNSWIRPAAWVGGSALAAVVPFLIVRRLFKRQSQPCLECGRNNPVRSAVCRWCRTWAR